MANRWIEGFDYLTTALLPLRDNVTAVAGTATVAAGGRNSGNSLRVSNNTGGIDVSLDAQATWIVGCAYRASTFTNSRTIFSLIDGAITHVTVGINVSGQIEVRRNAITGTLLATGTTVLTANIFYYIEAKLSISDTTGIVEVHINGVAETLTFVTGNGTNQDTRNAGNATANVVEFSFGPNAAAFTGDYDDIYINDGTGGVDDTYWGDIRVIAKSVDGAGNSAQFTPSTGSNWQNVDDATADGDATYNESSTVNHIDSMTTAAIGVTGTVKGVGVTTYARKTDAGAGSLAPLWRISATDFAGTGVALPTDYRFNTQLYRVSPSTSVAWTTAELDGAELGYKRTA